MYALSVVNFDIIKDKKYFTNSLLNFVFTDIQFTHIPGYIDNFHKANYYVWR